MTMKFADISDDFNNEDRQALARRYAGIRSYLPDREEAYNAFFSPADTVALVGSGIAQLCLQDRVKVQEIFPSLDRGRIDPEGVRFGVHWNPRPSGVEPHILMRYTDETGESHAYQVGGAHLRNWFDTGRITVEQIALLEECADAKTY
jgi:hypothetical protein